MEQAVDFLKTVVLEAFWDSPVTFSLVGLALLYLGWEALTRKGRMKRAAKKIAETAKIFDSEVEIAQVDLAKDFRKLDKNFYDQQTKALGQLGFQHVSDVEFVNLTRINPWMRTCLRLLAPSHGEICAAVYHVRITGWRRLLCALGGNADHYMTEFETELNDGSFVLTTNSAEAAKMSQPDEIQMHVEPADAPVPQLLQAHIAHVKDRLAKNPGARPRPTLSLEDVTAMQARFQGLQQKHRQSLGGGFTDEELENCIGGVIPDEDKNVLKEQVLALQAEKPEVPLRQSVEAPARQPDPAAAQEKPILAK